MKRVLLLFVLPWFSICATGVLNGATIYSVQDGMWSDSETWGGLVPDVTSDSIVIEHVITLDENVSLEDAGRLTILEAGSIYELHNKSLDLQSGTRLYNAGEIKISSMTNHGTIYNYGLIKLDGDLINHEGTIYNDAMIYVKNLLTQSGMLSGNGGDYMIENSLNSDPETIATCTGDPINICNPDGITDPCHGPGQFISGCVMICGQLLDLDLLAFNAETYQDAISVKLTWSTAHEIGISYYVVERTAPQILNWLPISPDIPAMGNHEDGVYHYTYTDTRPLVGINTYRLVCYHIDGEIAYSFIVSADVESAWVTGLAPNPFTQVINIHGDLSGYDKLEVIATTGQVLRVFETSIPQNVQLDFLASGWYTIRISGPIGELTFPILKI